MDGGNNGLHEAPSNARMALDDLPGRSVLDSTGRVIGRVDRVMVDLESWAVESLRVRLRREACADLGLEWSPFRPAALDVPTGLVLAARDAVILRAALDELGSLAPGREATLASPPEPLPPPTH